MIFYTKGIFFNINCCCIMYICVKGSEVNFGAGESKLVISFDKGFLSRVTDLFHNWMSGDKKTLLSMRSHRKLIKMYLFAGHLGTC